MRNPFIILRFVVLALLTYLNLFSIAITAWTISALKGDPGHIKVPSAFTFNLLNSCLFIVMIFLMVVELYWPKFRMSIVRRECVWAFANSIGFFVSAFQVTAAGPPFLCKTAATIDACVSSSILVTIAWVSSATVVVYLFCFLSATLTHTSYYPGIWKSSIYNVPWFVGWERQYRGFKLADELYGDKDSKNKNLVTPPLFAPEDDTDVEKHASRFFVSLPKPESVKSDRPAWAKEIEIRRGVDTPFARPQPKKAPLNSYWSTTTASPPPAPPKAAYAESRRDTGLPVITPAPSRPLSYGVFPAAGFDPERPVDTQRTGWVRARDQYRGY